MTTVAAYAAPAAKAPLERTTIERREVREHDVLIDIKFAGICHSDIHQVREGWGEAIFPMVPGHEIAGIVSEVGPGVTKFAVGDRVGVGCMVDSCRECENCRAGLEQYRTGGNVMTYNGVGKRRRADLRRLLREGRRRRELRPRHPRGHRAGRGRAAAVRRHHHVLPARRWNAGPGKKVAVVGMGGLGHMAVKLAHALGAEVTVLSQSLRKKDDGLKLGADHYYATSDPATFGGAGRHLRPDPSRRLRPARPRRLPGAAEDGGRPGQRRCPRGAGLPQPVRAARRRQDPRRVHDRRHPGDPGRCWTSAPSTASAPRSS